ncbi:hypothetical protein QUA86_03035 [Microcoleus sp. F6_B6]
MIKLIEISRAADACSRNARICTGSFVSINRQFLDRRSGNCQSILDFRF